MPRLILASQSVFRHQQLESLGLAFSCIAPKVDEELLKDPSLGPEQLCLFLAQKKAESVAKDHPNDIVVGADQLVDFNGEILGKAGSVERAEQQLSRLSGETHTLMTAFCAIYGGQRIEHIDRTQLRLRSLTATQIKNYVDRDQAWESAGSYKFERAGLGLIESVVTEDPSAIIGLPMIQLMDVLLSWNFPWLEKEQ